MPDRLTHWVHVKGWKWSVTDNRNRPFAIHHSIWYIQISAIFTYNFWLLSHTTQKSKDPKVHTKSVLYMLLRQFIDAVDGITTESFKKVLLIW